MNTAVHTTLGLKIPANRPDVQQALFSVAMLIVGAIISLVIALIAFFAQTRFTTSADLSVIGFLKAQVPLALTLLLNLSGVLLLESFFTKMPNKSWRVGVIQAFVLVILIFFVIFYVLDVAATTFSLYAALERLPTESDIAMSQDSLFSQFKLAAENTQRVSSSSWPIVFVCFALLCLFRAILTLHATKSLLDDNIKSAG